MVLSWISSSKQWRLNLNLRAPNFINKPLFGWGVSRFGGNLCRFVGPRLLSTWFYMILPWSPHAVLCICIFVAPIVLFIAFFELNKTGNYLPKQPKIHWNTHFLSFVFTPNTWQRPSKDSGFSLHLNSQLRATLALMLPRSKIPQQRCSTYVDVGGLFFLFPCWPHKDTKTGGKIPSRDIVLRILSMSSM